MTAHTVDAATKAGLDAIREVDPTYLHQGDWGRARVAERIIAAARPHIAAETTTELRARLVAAEQRMRELAQQASHGDPEGDSLRAGLIEGIRVALGHLDDLDGSRT